MKKLIYLLLLIILIIALFFGIRSCQQGRSITGAIKDSATGVVNTASSAKDSVTGMAKKAVKSTAKTAGSIASDVTSTAKDLTGKAADAVKKTGEKGAEIVEDTVDTLTDTDEDTDKTSEIETADDLEDTESALKSGLKKAKDATKDKVKKVATKVKDKIMGLGNFSKTKLSNGTVLNVPENGIENKLIDHIKNKKLKASSEWLNFDRINFASGSAKLTSKSQEQVDNIAKILKANPSVKLKIGGYTDNTGSKAFNMKLSSSRAKAVKSAIVKDGITSSRLTHVGYGPLHPVASNNTEEGKAKNRRIAVKITKW